MTAYIKMPFVLCLLLLYFSGGCGQNMQEIKIQPVKIAGIGIPDWAVLNQDGSYVIIGNIKNVNNRYCNVLYNINTHEKSTIWESDVMVCGAAFHPFDSKIIACIDENSVGLVDIKTNKTTLLCSFARQYARAVSFSLDGKHIYAVISRIDRNAAPAGWDENKTGPYNITEILIIDIKSKKISDTISLNECFASAATFSKTKNLAGIRQLNGKADIWDLDQKKCLQSVQHYRGDKSITLFNDQYFLTDGSSSSDATNMDNIVLWSIATGKKVKGFNFHHGHVCGIGIVYCNTDDPYVLSGGQDLFVNLWNINSGTLKWTKKFRYDVIIAVSGNGKRAMIFSADAPLILDF